MVYTNRIRSNADRRPQAFWGALIGAGASLIGGLVSGSQQSRAQKRALEEQKRLAQQQLEVSNQNQLAATLNNYALAQQSYDDKDYNLKYRIGGVKRLGGRNIMITDGGNAKKIGNNTYLLRGGSHEDINETGQTGIGINVGGNEIEAEGGEVAQRKGNSLRIYSAQPILGGISPAEAIMKGYNKDRVFNAQQRFKKNNGIKDDGSKAKYGTTIPYKRIHINEDGTFTDILTGKNYTTSATNGEDIVITGKENHWKEAGKKDTSSYFDPMGAIHFASAACAPILNATPSNIFGSIREAKDFNSFINNYMNYDSGGFFNKEYAEKHPYISFIGNLIADGVIGGLANKGIDGYKLAKSFYKSEKPYINTIANSRLYSDNPIINAYATYARRYNLPDKARVPYMIRRVESDELPTINNGRITMSGDRFKHTNFTYDRPVVSHRKGKWDSAQQTYLINGRRLVSENKGNWGSIEPSDMFTIQDPKGGLRVPTKDVILVSGHKGLLGQAKASGIKIATSPQLQRIEKSITTKQSLGRLNLAGERRHYNTPYWIDVNNIVKKYGTPKLKDVRLLEEMTGLKSGVIKLDNKAIKIINDANRFNKLKVSEAEEVMNQVYPNGRGVNFTNDREVYIIGQFPYNNLFYDPTTYAESNYVFPKRLGGHCKFKFGGLTSKDRGSSKHPYPSVSSKDFAGGNRSYPIPTKADAIDALRLAGLHGRSDVRSKVYNKYPELRKKARGGTKIEPYYDWARNTSSNLGISFIDPTYDYRTYYNSVTPYERNLIRFAPQGTHFTDIGKTPKHPTFSNESIYSNKKHSGGTWNGNVFVPNIWQFGNNGNKVRNKYMNNSGEGYFNGRVNIFPKYRKRIAKRMGGLTNPPVERFKCGGHIRPKAKDGMLATIYSYGTNRRLPSFAPIDVTTRAIPNFKPIYVSTNTKVPFDPNSVPFLGNQSTFKPATQDYIGLGIDTLAALGSGMFTRSAYNKMNFDYALPNYVDESPVAFDTTYHNEAQQANIERNRLNARNLIRGNTASAQTSLGRMQQTDTDAMMETNKLLDEKSNKEVELRNQNAANEQQVRARNAAARNQYYQNVAQIKNAAIEAKNNMELAKAQSIGADLSGLSQAWTNFAGSVESRYDNRQKEAIIAATAKDPAVLSNAVQFGYNFSPEVLAAIYNSTDDDNLKSLALSQLSTKNRLRYGIR